MIAKGTTHNNGARLAAYMTTAKEGERAELWQLRGFEATNIKDAFRDVHIMAEATKCQQPFFHLQLRNREAETFTREQWEFAANRIERMLGLTGQPRAIAFHTYEHNGDEHMHVAWSRIDEEKLIAKPLPFFKERLKNICRELELHFALEPVTNQRESDIKYAPKRAEHEQARRLGLDIHEIRNTIRSCYDRSDCGASFRAALEQEGLALAQGERRDFVAIDQAGGVHALGKRILDVTAARIRERLSDLSREQLPTVEMAREAMLGRELAEVQKAIETEQRRVPVWDRDTVVQEINWEEQLARAGIEKEKQERRFVGPPGREGKQDKKLEADRSTVAQEIAWEEDLTRAAIDKDRTDRKIAQFNRAARAQNRDAKAPHEVERQIGEARKCSDSPKAFRLALAEKGISLARATKDDATQSQLESADAKLAGKWKPTIREGEIVAVSGPGFICKLVPRVTGDKYPKDIQNFLATLDQPLPSILEAKHDREQDRDFERMRRQGRSATPPHGQSMVQQQAWALDRVRAADQFRRKEDERHREETARRSSGEIDPARYLADPDYRRQVKAERAYQTPAERRTARENEARVMQEQQDRQR